jgi:hypothetical protein
MNMDDKSLAITVVAAAGGSLLLLLLILMLYRILQQDLRFRKRQQLYSLSNKNAGIFSRDFVYLKDFETHSARAGWSIK